MPRPLWSGSISFGLINIPVRLFSASVERELSFELLHEKDLSPIHYARICRAEGKEIPYDDIVKGYEYRKGDFVILHDEDFAKADLHLGKSIDVFEFTDEAEIDSIYYDKPYYLEPDAKAGKAYVILREALRKSKKVGVAKYVMRNKEHLAVIRPEGNMLVLENLRFKDELRKPKLSIPQGRTSAREISMALKLIDQLSAHFQPEKYHDSYTEKLKRLIMRKAHGKPVHIKGKAPVPTKTPDIMSLLRKSLEKKSTRAHAKRT